MLWGSTAVACHASAVYVSCLAVGQPDYPCAAVSSVLKGLQQALLCMHE